jgi:hypothetical protein
MDLWLVVDVVAGGAKTVEVKGTGADDAAGELVECGVVLGFEVAGATVSRAVVSGVVAAALDGVDEEAAADVEDTAELVASDDWAAEVIESAVVEEPLVPNG